ncbi:MAG TPA: glycoside hydrolase family 75 protein, partial [Chthoniobacterales bacterium]|nr:glycoside hydrolase family 75 protein [Chthoniobacterales bacterium]
MRTLRLFALLLVCAAMAAIILRWISLERWRKKVAQNAEEPVRLVEVTPIPAPGPRTQVIGGKLETSRLFSGITVNATVEPTSGGPASEERVDPQSYVLDLKLHARVPAPNKTVDELAKVNPELPRLLPGLPAMVKPESVSPFYHELYETKIRRLRANLTRLDQLLSRHNFYDCQTILQLQHPETKRKAVLIQAEMDVDADGSDSDRLPAGSGVSTHFQPYTSYRWPKKTSNPSAYLTMLEERIKTHEAEANQKGTSGARKAELKGAIANARDGIDQLKRFSFLIGATDPFIVIPGGFTKTEGAKVGDYAVVITGDKIYPALVGDVGPADKAGEASLRIAKEISGDSSPYNRPVSDLKVTYLIFPETADTPWGPPDLDKIHARCEALVNEIGGAAAPLHKWVDILP